jgi:hypothetical protein
MPIEGSRVRTRAGDVEGNLDHELSNLAGDGVAASNHASGCRVRRPCPHRGQGPASVLDAAGVASSAGNVDLRGSAVGTGAAPCAASRRAQAVSSVVVAWLDAISP